MKTPELMELKIALNELTASASKMGTTLEDKGNHTVAGAYLCVMGLAMTVSEILEHIIEKEDLTL